MCLTARLLVVLLAAGCARVSEDEAAADASAGADASAAADAGPRPDAPPDAAPDAPPEPPPRYPRDRTLSPITPSVARSLLAIVERSDGQQDDVFAKVGDSITVAPQFLTCFAGAAVDLGDHADLQPTLDRFAGGDAAGTTPYQRTSAAAGVGWSADAVVGGDPSLLTVELDAIAPRYAVVMFGSNDAASRSIFTFGKSMLAIVDGLEARGVIPLMSTVPPNDQEASVDARLPLFNTVVRGIAQARQVPLMDYWREMDVLPGHGLGPDGLHPNAYSGGACKLTPTGLMYGYNVRNLLTLETLDRARAIVEGDPPPDPPATAPAVFGAGSYDDPFVVNDFPFTDLRDTRQSENTISQYTGCNATQDESGPEYVYRLTLTSALTVHAMVIDGDAVDIDLHLMSGLTPDTCLLRHDREISADLAAGTYYFILDTFVPAGGTAQAGEYLLVLMSE